MLLRGFSTATGGKEASSYQQNGEMIWSMQAAMLVACHTCCCCCCCCHGMGMPRLQAGTKHACCSCRIKV
jgi:hypothetical protein